MTLEKFSEKLMERGLPRGMVVALIAILWYPVKNFKDIAEVSILGIWVCMFGFGAGEVIYNFGTSLRGEFSIRDFLAGVVALLFCAFFIMYMFGTEEAEKVVPQSRKEKDE